MPGDSAVDQIHNAQFPAAAATNCPRFSVLKEGGSVGFSSSPQWASVLGSGRRQSLLSQLPGDGRSGSGFTLLEPFSGDREPGAAKVYRIDTHQRV